MALKHKLIIFDWQGTLASEDGRMLEGVIEFLEQLKASGHTLAIASNAGRRGIEQALEAHGTSHFFSAIRTASDTFSKPNPQMLLDILEQLGVNAQDAVMVGDDDIDLKLAENAGVEGIQVIPGSAWWLSL